MKIYKSLIYLILVLFVSCNVTDDVQEQGIDIQLNIPSRATIGIKSVSLKIEASDMDTMEASTTALLDTSLTDNNTIKVQVPTGDARTFSIIVTLDDGSTLSGSKTKDIKSTTSTIYIDINYGILSSAISTYLDSSAAYIIQLVGVVSETGYKFSATVSPTTDEVVTYQWYLDGVEQVSETTDSIDFTGLSSTDGTQQVSVFVTIDGNLYSQSTYIDMFSTVYGNELN